MSITWSRLAGDTSRFALSLSFEADPDGGVAADPEDAASWGAIQLWVEGKNLTLHSVDGLTSGSVQWYLLPFLEWVAHSWNPLLHEERPPAEPQASDAVHDLRASSAAPPTLEGDDAFRWESNWYQWWDRHALRSSREGGLFPDVVMRRWRDKIELSWEPDTTPGADDLQFHVPYGQARLAPDEVAHPLYDSVLAAAEELNARIPKSARVGRLVRHLTAVSDPEMASKRLLWMVDAGNTGRARRQWRRVNKTLEGASKGARDAALAVTSDALVVTGSCHAALLFGAVSPSLANRDVTKLAQLLIDVYNPSGEQGPLLGYASPQPLHSVPGPAWNEGWLLAEQTFEALNPPGTTWVDIETLLERVSVPVIDLPLDDEEIRGLSIAGEKHRWTICINPSYHDGNDDEVRRFTMAHELCHLLYDRGREQKVAIASGPWAPKDIERRANAFAALFLMPRHLVRVACRDAGDLRELSAIEHVAHQLHTSVTATLHHLSNLYVIDEGTRDRLLSELRRR
jgi:Zn-dependent peptidase ImmA (M78 family)